MAVLNWPRTGEGVVPKRVTLFGPTGSGKTTMAAKVVPLMVRQPEQIVCVGPKPDLANALGRPWNNISPYDKKAIQSFFAKLYDSPAHMVVVIDDFDLYSNARDYEAPALHELVRIGRGYGKGMVVTADGAATIPKTFISNSDAVIFFRTSEPNLTDYIRRYMRDDFPGGPGEAEKTIRELPTHEAVLWMPNETPKFRGWLKVVHGQLLLIPPDQESPEPVSDADDSSETSTGAGTAETISPSTTGNGDGSIRPDPGTGFDSAS